MSLLYFKSNWEILLCSCHTSVCSLNILHILQTHFFFIYRKLVLFCKFLHLKLTFLSLYKFPDQWKISLILSETEPIFTFNYKFTNFCKFILWILQDLSSESRTSKIESKSCVTGLIVRPSNIYKTTSEENWNVTKHFKIVVLYRACQDNTICARKFSFRSAFVLGKVTELTTFYLEQFFPLVLWNWVLPTTEWLTSLYLFS